MHRAPPRPRVWLIPLLAVALAALAPGCTNVPELDETIPDWARDARYPQLIPLTGDLASRPATGAEAQALKGELAARAAGLQARADRLRARDPDAE